MTWREVVEVILITVGAPLVAILIMCLISGYGTK